MVDGWNDVRESKTEVMPDLVFGLKPVVAVSAGCPATAFEELIGAGTDEAVEARW
jgi:hypothetical protein